MVSKYQAGINSEFSNITPALERARSWVFDAVRNYCNTHEFLFDGRLKGLDSAAAKLETGRFATLLELDDLVACSVIVPTISKCAEAVEALKKLLNVDLHKSRPAFTPSRSFQFENDRLYANYFDSALDKNIRFEVQVMTMFEFAWQKVTHDYDYKSQDVAWKRSRIAALLRAAVESLDLQVAAIDGLESALPDRRDRASSRLAPIFETLRNLQSEDVVLLPDPARNTRRYAELVMALSDRTRYGGKAPENALLDDVLQVINEGKSTSATFGQICAHVASANRKDDDFKFRFLASSVLATEPKFRRALIETSDGVQYVSV